MLPDLIDKILFIHNILLVEVRRDFTEYYEDKMRRVQRKVDNLRKALLSSYLLNILFLFFIY